MASTRNRNQVHEHHLETWQRNKMASFQQHETAAFFAQSPLVAFAGFALGNPSIAHRQLDSHFCDTESFLRGIGANNLVATTEYLPPQPHVLPSLDIAAAPKQYVPATYIPPVDQREMILN